MERIARTNISVDSIQPGPWQPRLAIDEAKLKELASSIQQHGLIYPVMIRLVDGHQELISGERRWRAARLAGLAEIPAMLVTGTDQELQELALLDNIQRENLTPLEEARAFDGLMMAYGYSTRQVAKKLGKSNGYITDRLRLLELSDEAAQMTTEREIPQRTLRDVATLPEEVQAPALAYLQDTKAWEGQATTRQATIYLKALGSFLDPEHWTVPLDVVVTPETRNFLRLIQELLFDSDLEEIGQRLVGLRYAGHWRRNVLGTPPVDMDSIHIVYVLDAIMGDGQGGDAYWREYAPAFGWRCESCICGALPAEEREEIRFYCPLAYEMDGADRGSVAEAALLPGDRRSHADSLHRIETCPRFIGAGDPVVITLDRWNTLEYFQEVVVPPEEIQKGDGVGSYIADLDLYVRLYKAACRAKSRGAQEQAQAGRQKHVAPLQEYACHLLEDQRLAAGHGMAHDCRQCAHHVAGSSEPAAEAELLPGARRAHAGESPHDLCGYLQEPLKARHGDETRAPEFGILVREDGLMVPRCELFHYSAETLPELPRLAGFRLPDHKVVVGWIDTICRSGGSYDRQSTVCGVLAWLPSRRARDKAWERGKLLSHLRKAWDVYGDEEVAWLIGAALLEARARSAWSGGIVLLNPGSGLEEKWRPLSWRDFVAGSKPWGWREEWPTPWVEESGEEAGGGG